MDAVVIQPGTPERALVDACLRAAGIADGASLPAAKAPGLLGGLGFSQAQLGVLWGVSKLFYRILVVLLVLFSVAFAVFWGVVC
jgi:hypothetical protein